MSGPSSPLRSRSKKFCSSPHGTQIPCIIPCSPAYWKSPLILHLTTAMIKNSEVFSDGIVCAGLPAPTGNGMLCCLTFSVCAPCSPRSQNPHITKKIKHMRTFRTHLRVVPRATTLAEFHFREHRPGDPGRGDTDGRRQRAVRFWGLCFGSSATMPSPTRAGRSGRACLRHPGTS